MKKYKLIYWLIIVPSIILITIGYLYYDATKDIEKSNNRGSEFTDSLIKSDFNNH